MSGWRGHRLSGGLICALLLPVGLGLVEMLHEPHVEGLAPTGCQALCGWCRGFRAPPGAVGHYGKNWPCQMQFWINSLVIFIWCCVICHGSWAFDNFHRERWFGKTPLGPSSRPRKIRLLASLFSFILSLLLLSYHNCEKYPLSPLKSRFLALIEQYLHNISDPVYLVHQSFIWFLWLNWRKSTFYPITAPMIQNVDLLWSHRYKSWPPAIVTSQWLIVPVWFLWRLS